MSDQQVRDEAMTLFLAGHETTALALSWTWYLLSQHPEVEEQLAAEVRTVLCGRLPNAEDVSQLTFVEQVVLESMRLFPPVYVIGREAIEPCEIGGFHVPRGTTMLMSEWVLHRDPRFFERPEAFDPAALDAGLSEATAEVRLLPFRRRTQAVHRQRVRHDGNGPGAGDDYPALSVHDATRHAGGALAWIYIAAGTGNPSVSRLPDMKDSAVTMGTKYPRGCRCGRAQPWRDAGDDSWFASQRDRQRRIILERMTRNASQVGELFTR